MNQPKHKRIYVKFLVYNYDANSRYQDIEYTVGSLEKAKEVVALIKKQIKHQFGENSTEKWTNENLHVYGFIVSIHGIYRQITEKLT